MTKRISRRDVLKTAVAAAPLIVSASALGYEGPSANERANIGLIGLGGRCRGLSNHAKQVADLRIVAACDCFKPRVDAMIKGSKWTGYTDFRKMIEKEKLDGVMVETTTHARAWVACHAMAMGCDAYIEKPMSLTIGEGRDMVNIARKYKRVTQVGTQQRSIPLNNFASDLVKNGAIGKIRVVEAPNFVGPDLWTPTPGQPMPDGGSDNWWDIWTNQAELRPFHRSIHTGWARYWDYDGGGRCFGVTGWGAHSYDQINRGLGTDDTGPTKILLEEELAVRDSGRYDQRSVGGGETGSRYYRMAKLKGPRAKVRMYFANGTELRLNLDGDKGPGLGCIFVGEKGKIEVNRDKVSANPKELLTSDENPGKLKVGENVPHIQNWADCIKSRKRANADIEIGQRASTLCYLVNIVREVGTVGEKLAWDPKTERFTNSDAGNKLLTRPRRKGYELPT
jgi:predicted dehydrogenase